MWMANINEDSWGHHGSRTYTYLGYNINKAIKLPFGEGALVGGRGAYHRYVTL